MLVKICSVDEFIVPLFVTTFYSLEVVRLITLLEDLLKDRLKENLIAKGNQLFSCEIVIIEVLAHGS